MILLQLIIWFAIYFVWLCIRPKSLESENDDYIIFYDED
jgi:hypothetical protein